MKSEQLSQEQLSILAGLPKGEPIVMLNLLRFRATAQSPQTDEALSGAEAYERYSKIARPALARVGASLVFMGKPSLPLVGPGDERWDLMFLIKYPSVEAFASMVSAPEYQAALEHRTAALEDSRLTPIIPTLE
ncbi:MAG: DUF1330 domain-containing protein [Alteromonadaceae bacterium]|nr:DUF1330 domain-containing protein [Alteromonadaceae bacterium]